MILAYSGGDFFVSGGVVIVFRLRAPTRTPLRALRTTDRAVPKATSPGSAAPRPLMPQRNVLRDPGEIGGVARDERDAGASAARGK
jgi:hypothetical protein